jgi:hypothetical protein
MRYTVMPNNTYNYNEVDAYKALNKEKNDHPRTRFNIQTEEWFTEPDTAVEAMVFYE